ncbi:MAG: helix-turn-helix domain-containing protein [Allosphingosinicella sp.]
MVSSDKAANLLLALLRINSPLTIIMKSLMEGAALSVNEWRVVYTIARSHPAFGASDIGRRLRLPRQTIQRIADDLEQRGLLEFKPNPDHKKASILALSEAGRSAYAAGNRRQYDIAEWLSQDLSEAEVATTLGVLEKLELRLGKADLEMLCEGKFPPPGR